MLIFDKLSQQHQCRQIFFFGQHANRVAYMQTCGGRRHRLRFVGMDNARYHQRDTAQTIQFGYGHAIYLIVADSHIDANRLFAIILGLMQRLFLVAQIDAEHPTQNHKRQDDTHHAERIRHGIAVGNIGIDCAVHIAKRLLRRA